MVSPSMCRIYINVRKMCMCVCLYLCVRVYLCVCVCVSLCKEEREVKLYIPIRQVSVKGGCFLGRTQREKCGRMERLGNQVLGEDALLQVMKTLVHNGSIGIGIIVTGVISLCSVGATTCIPM